MRKYTIELWNGIKITDVQEGTKFEVSRTCYGAGTLVYSFEQKVELLNSNVMLKGFGCGEKNTWYLIKSVTEQEKTFEERLDEPIEIIIRGSKASGKTTLKAILAIVLDRFCDVVVDEEAKPQAENIFKTYVNSLKNKHWVRHDADVDTNNMCEVFKSRSGEVILKEETV